MCRGMVTEWACSGQEQGFLPLGIRNSTCNSNGNSTRNDSSNDVSRYTKLLRILHGTWNLDAATVTSDARFKCLSRAQTPGRGMPHDDGDDDDDDDDDGYDDVDDEYVDNDDDDEYKKSNGVEKVHLFIYEHRFFVIVLGLRFRGVPGLDDFGI